jgi:hypothetical protein
LLIVTESWTTVETVFFVVGIATPAVLLIIAIVVIVHRCRGKRQNEPLLQAHFPLPPMLPDNRADTVRPLLAHQQQPNDFGPLLAYNGSVADTQITFGEDVSNMADHQPQAIYAQVKPNKQRTATTESDAKSDSNVSNFRKLNGDGE